MVYVKLNEAGPIFEWFRNQESQIQKDDQTIWQCWMHKEKLSDDDLELCSFKGDRQSQSGLSNGNQIAT